MLMRAVMFCLLIVALRKESVDRNVNLRILDGSKSSVALRKESVDRNASTLLVYLALIRSLSARRAWIEMVFLWWGVRKAVGRSPQGERG